MKSTVEYNVDHKDELLLVDFRSSLQADMQKAREEMRLCASIIRMPRLGLNSYLCNAYVESGNRYTELWKEWEKWFPGEQPMMFIDLEEAWF